MSRSEKNGRSKQKVMNKTQMGRAEKNNKHRDKDEGECGKKKVLLVKLEDVLMSPDSGGSAPRDNTALNVHVGQNQLLG